MFLLVKIFLKKARAFFQKRKLFFTFFKNSVLFQKFRVFKKFPVRKKLVLFFTFFKNSVLFQKFRVFKKFPVRKKLALFFTFSKNSVFFQKFRVLQKYVGNSVFFPKIPCFSQNSPFEKSTSFSKKPTFTQNYDS